MNVEVLGPIDRIANDSKHTERPREPHFSGTEVSPFPTRYGKLNYQYCHVKVLETSTYLREDLSIVILFFHNTSG
jgi:hypothetical protein